MPPEIGVGVVDSGVDDADRHAVALDRRGVSPCLGRTNHRDRGPEGRPEPWNTFDAPHTRKLLDAERIASGREDLKAVAESEKFRDHDASVALDRRANGYVLGNQTPDRRPGFGSARRRIHAGLEERSRRLAIEDDVECLARARCAGKAGGRHSVARSDPDAA